MLWAIEADLDLLANLWNVPRTDATAPCAFCQCTDIHGDRPWNNFELPVQTYNPVLYSQSPMYKIPGVTLSTVYIDWVDTKYLGTDQYFMGQFCSQCVIC